MHWKHDRVQVRGANRSGSNSISEQNQWSVQSTLWETRCARVSGRASAGCAERKQLLGFITAWVVTLLCLLLISAVGGMSIFLVYFHLLYLVSFFFILSSKFLPQIRGTPRACGTPGSAPSGHRPLISPRSSAVRYGLPSRWADFSSFPAHRPGWTPSGIIHVWS